jgi:hypothetical protein
VEGISHPPGTSSVFSDVLSFCSHNSLMHVLWARKVNLDRSMGPVGLGAIWTHFFSFTATPCPSSVTCSTTCFTWPCLHLHLSAVSVSVFRVTWDQDEENGPLDLHCSCCHNMPECFLPRLSSGSLSGSNLSTIYFLLPCYKPSVWEYHYYCVGKDHFP